MATERLQRRVDRLLDQAEEAMDQLNWDAVRQYAQALREVLITGIEELRPPGEHTGLGAPGALQYHILHEHYVQRRPVAYILTSLNIAEATYFRNRKDAILALARHLEAQEELIVQAEKKG